LLREVGEDVIDAEQEQPLQRHTDMIARTERNRQGWRGECGFTNC
jgi:hypothetical protein